MPKIIMLAGAPEIENWTEQDMTVDAFLPAFKSFFAASPDAGINDARRSPTGSAPDTTHPRPVWRSIPIRKQHLETGWSQPDWLKPPLSFSNAESRDEDEIEDTEISFLTTTSAFEDETDASFLPHSSAELSQFLENSFALHDEADQSHVTPAAKTPLLRDIGTKRLSNQGNEADEPLVSEATSSPKSIRSSLSPTQKFNNTRSAGKAPANPETPLHPRQRTSVSLPYLTPLSSLPTAPKLIALEPQTVTVDLLVGVISVSARRTVTIRRTGREIDLLEVLVGDETKAGIGITFWLPEDSAPTNSRADTATQRDGGLKAAVEALRPGDIVGMRSVALSHFRGRVHGQSLGGSGRSRGAQTSVVKIDDALAEASLARHPGSGLLAKYERVKAWTRDFVRPAGVVDVVAGSKKRKRVSDELPPDDTQ